MDSTNDEAKRQAAAGAREGTLIVATEQRRGRGRRGRGWRSPPGNLYCSLLLRPDCAVGAAAQLSFVCAVALAETLATWLDSSRIGLKWPNDVLVDGAKACGILLESTSGPEGRLDWLVIGIGINVASQPEGLGRQAISLAAAGAGDATVEATLERLASAFTAWYARWCREGFAPVRAAWTARAVGLGAPVRASLTSGTVEGIFEALDASGALVYRRADGERGRIEAGEVYFDA